VRAPRTFLAVLVAAAVTAAGCGSTREEMRRERLDTFRSVLPGELLAAFDAIEAETGCAAVGQMLSEARAGDPRLDAAVDSIMHAELIDTFSDVEVVTFFWLYFDHALETGTVRGP